MKLTLSTYSKNFTLLLAVITFGWAFYSMYKIMGSIAPDFNVLWNSSRDFIYFKNPYLDTNLIFPLLLPPVSLIFYVPLVFLDYKIAQFIFLIVSFISTLGAVYFSLKISFKKFSIYTFLLASSLAFLSFPTKFTLGMGQVNSISLFLLIVSYYFYQKNSPLISGVILGVSIVSKPIFGFFVLFFLIKKSWRVIFYMLITILVGVVLLVSVGHGLDYVYFWLNHVLPAITATSGKEIYYNQSLSGFIARNISNAVIQRYSYGIGAILLIFVTTYQNIKIKNQNLGYSMLITTLLLADDLSWQHHFVWVIFPFIVLTGYAIKLKKLSFWIFLTLAYVFISWNFKNPQSFSQFPMSLVLSNTFYGVAILYCLNFYLIKRGDS